MIEFQYTHFFLDVKQGLLHTYILIITGVQASGVIFYRLLRQCCFVWSEIVGPHFFFFFFFLFVGFGGGGGGVY